MHSCNIVEEGQGYHMLTLGWMRKLFKLAEDTLMDKISHKYTLNEAHVLKLDLNVRLTSFGKWHPIGKKSLIFHFIQPYPF